MMNRMLGCFASDEAEPFVPAAERPPTPLGGERMESISGAMTEEGTRTLGVEEEW